MPSLKDVKDVVYNGLMGMGYNPINLVMTEVITDASDGYWKIKGEFKGGFMGEAYKFDLKYSPDDNGLANVKVIAYTSNERYS